MEQRSLFQLLKNGIIDENPIFVQVIAMCPTLAVTTSAVNGFSMGLATTMVITLSCLLISLIRGFIPDRVRLPIFIVVIAGFVTVIEFLMAAFLPELNNSLGLFIPLIAVNCLLFARAESFASKNGPLKSVTDAFGMGLGFTAALFVLGFLREFFGEGSILGATVLHEEFPRTVLLILPPGAFIMLGLLTALLNYIRIRASENKEN
jgi:electron transport complex protein RnfE